MHIYVFISHIYKFKIVEEMHKKLTYNFVKYYLINNWRKWGLYYTKSILHLISCLKFEKNKSQEKIQISKYVFAHLL